MIASGNHLLTQVKDNQPSLRLEPRTRNRRQKAERSDRQPDQRQKSMGNQGIQGVPGQGLVPLNPWQN